MRQTLLVARHEFVRHLRKPVVLITTFLVLLILGVVLLVTGHISTPGDAPAPPVAGTPTGYVDASGLLTAPLTGDLATRLRAFADEAGAQAALRQGAIVGYYRFPVDYLAGGPVVWVRDSLSGPQDTTAVEALVRASLLADEPALAAQLAAPPSVRFVPLGAEAPGGPVERGLLAGGLPYAFAVILILTTFFAAGFLLQSVTEERENRTIEIVLTSLRPLELLAGKVLGLGLLGLLQVAVWIGAGLLLLRLSGAPLPAGDFVAPWAILALALAAYVLGYLIYGSILAGVGASLPTMREGAPLLGLLTLPCIIPLWLTSAILAQPDGILALALSTFPLTAPVTLMIRASLTTIAPWEIAVSMLALAASAGLALWLAARLFNVSMLLTGQRLSMRAVLQALR
jgi:ABC-2 type transport system permease protein